jgi:Tfp pilus assembly protein PilN
MRLQTNLATRPFYNVRAVHAVISGLALLVLGLTLLNAVQLVRLTSSQRALGARAAEAEHQAEQLRSEATRIRTQINQKELEAVSAAAREANAIIDRRAFSWTELLEQLEATLPADVRITTVQPRLEEGVFRVAMAAEARRPEDVADFIDALEKTGAFRDVVPLREEVSDDGLVSTALDTVYMPPPRDAEASAEAPATDKGAR